MMVTLNDIAHTYAAFDTKKIVSVMAKADRVLPFDSKLKYLYRDLQLNKQYRDSNQER